MTFEPIEIQNHKAPQNDRLNLSFVKDEHTNGKKMARNGRKTAIYESVLFYYVYTSFFIPAKSLGCQKFIAAALGRPLSK